MTNYLQVVHNKMHIDVSMEHSLQPDNNQLCDLFFIDYKSPSLGSQHLVQAFWNLQTKNPITTKFLKELGP